MKKTFKIVLTLIIAFTFTNAISSEASAATTTTKIEVHQSISKPSSKVFLTKNAKVTGFSNSTGTRKITVSLVNSQTGKVIKSGIMSNTNNKVVTLINSGTVPAGLYHIVLTCTKKTSCQGAAILTGS